MKISLVIPCYNEEEVLPGMIAETKRVIDGPGLSAYSFELLLVDDGSKDGTLELMRGFAREDTRVRYLSFSRNFGKESAMLAGLRHAEGDLVAVMDADMQDPPALLPEMVRILESGEYDCVATRRADRAGEPRVRSFFARAFYRIINRISDANIMDGARDFRLMRREMVDAVLSMEEYNRFSKGIFGWVGFRTFWLPYENVERASGKTKWSFWKLLRYSIEGIVDFSQVPLALSAWMGLLCTAFAILMVIFVVVRRLLFGDPVAGWPSLVCIILFIGGLQFFCIGIMGQYLSKMYLEVKRRPHYIVMETEEQCRRETPESAARDDRNNDGA